MVKVHTFLIASVMNSIFCVQMLIKECWACWCWYWMILSFISLPLKTVLLHNGGSWNEYTMHGVWSCELSLHWETSIIFTGTVAWDGFLPIRSSLESWFRIWFFFVLVKNSLRLTPLYSMSIGVFSIYSLRVLLIRLYSLKYKTTLKLP